MLRGKKTVRSLVSGLLSAALLLAASQLAAQATLSSEIYSKSRIISMIIAQDEVGVLEMAGNKDNVDLLLKFTGAVTSAYINFELIPLGEVSTFVAVFESVQNQVRVDGFEYHRKNLTITGTAPTESDYGQFLTRLRDTEHFTSVTGHSYLTVDDDIQFTLECTARSADSSGYLNLDGG